MIRTHFRWQDVDAHSLRGHCAVVIDVLRWSTVVIEALSNGADFVEAYATPEEAVARAELLGREEILLGGERDNVALPGFDVGNSPAEYTPARIAARGVITSTTNGTQGLLAAREAATVLVGAFVNLPVVVEAVVREVRAGRPVALIACGQAGAIAEEDLACAGAIAMALQANVSDAATDAACAAWARAGRDTAAVMAGAGHAATLRAAGFGADVDYAARIGVLDCVPRLASRQRLQASYGSPPAPSPN